MPPWERRLVGNIERLRCDIARMTSYADGIRSTKLEKIVKCIMDRTSTHSHHDEPNTTVQQCIDTLKQKLSVLTNRLSRYRTSRSRKRDNVLFERSEKNFYRKLGKKEEENYEGLYPTQQEVSDFWSNQLSNPMQCDLKASWIGEEKKRCENFTAMQHQVFTNEEVSEVIKNLLNWKAPGPDKIHNFWYKRFWCTHQKTN